MKHFVGERNIVDYQLHQISNIKYQTSNIIDYQLHETISQLVEYSHNNITTSSYATRYPTRLYIKAFFA